MAPSILLFLSITIGLLQVPKILLVVVILIIMMQLPWRVVPVKVFC